MALHGADLKLRAARVSVKLMKFNHALPIDSTEPGARESAKHQMTLIPRTKFPTPMHRLSRCKIGRILPLSDLNSARSLRVGISVSEAPDMEEGGGRRRSQLTGFYASTRQLRSGKVRDEVERIRTIFLGFLDDRNYVVYHALPAQDGTLSELSWRSSVQSRSYKCIPTTSQFFPNPDLGTFWT